MATLNWYVNTESANTGTTGGYTSETSAGVKWALGFDGGEVDPTGSVIREDGASPATGTVDEVILKSGSWATSDAKGILILTSYSGTWTDNDIIELTNDTKVADAYIAADNWGPNEDAYAYDANGNWENNRATNLVTDGDSYILNLGGTGDDGLLFINNTWTTGISNTITYIGNNDTGKWSNSHYRNSRTATGNGHDVVYTNVPNVTFKFIQAHITAASRNSCNAFACDSEDNVTFDSCIAKATLSGTSLGCNGFFYELSAGELGVIQNCLAYDFDNTATYICSGIANVVGDADSITAVNNTIVDCYRAFDTAGSDCIMKNNLTQGCTSQFPTTYGTGTGYNLTDLATASWGTNSVNNTTATFVNAGAEDYHLDNSAGNIADVFGKSLGTTDSDTPSVDIDGDARASAVTDPGCDLYVASGTILPQIMHHRQQQE